MFPQRKLWEGRNHGGDDRKLHSLLDRRRGVQDLGGSQGENEGVVSHVKEVEKPGIAAIKRRSPTFFIKNCCLGINWG